MLRLFDDDVLEQIAEAGVDGALVAVIDLQVVGNRTLLAHGSIGLNQHRAGRVAVSGARGFELLERAQPRLDAGELLFARADGSRAPFVLDAGARQLRLARGHRDARRVDRLARAAQSVGACGAIGGDAFGFDPHVGGFDVELRQRLRHPIAGGCGMLDRVAQRRRRVDRRKHFASRRFDIRFEALDFAMRCFVGLGLGGKRRRGAFAFGIRLGGRDAPIGQRRARRLAALLDGVGFRRYRR